MTKLIPPNLQVTLSQCFGTDLFEWQLDVTEAILLGLDSVVIAGIRAGKTMLFMMPLLLDKAKKVLIVSLLKVLQADQVQISYVSAKSEDPTFK